MADDIVLLDGFEGLRCSRPNCGGPADILAPEDSEVVIVCRHCANTQTLGTATYPMLQVVYDAAVTVKAAHADPEFAEDCGGFKSTLEDLFTTLEELT